MSHTGATPIAGSQTAVETVNLYAGTLTDIGERASALQAAVAEARCAGPGRQRAALVVLHNRSRDVAAVLNQALGDWHLTEGRQS